MENTNTHTDEYFATALQIFNYCGADSSSTMRVDTLMNKFEPLVKTNNMSDCSYLRSLLDPEHNNPEINVDKLATTLNIYSRSLLKVDLDESFNLRSGDVPQDSDSGISTDGSQLIDDLQSKLREEAHLAQQLRSQLECTHRQHEETVTTLTVEQDSLRAQLNMLREKNNKLTNERADYDEICDRLSDKEKALEEMRNELDSLKRQHKQLSDQVITLENEKMSLQESLRKSRNEYNRIKEIYASRQATLIEENECLRTENSDLIIRIQSQDEMIQEILEEKNHLEVELKDVFHKSNQNPLRMDQSIDYSYTEEQMLTALDSVYHDTRSMQDDHVLLDDDSFLRCGEERLAQMSLLDEIQLRVNSPFQHLLTKANANWDQDKSLVKIGTQTEDVVVFNYRNAPEHKSTSTQADEPCEKCAKRNASRRSLRSYLWEGSKCLFLLFATLCFVFAVLSLYGVTRQSPVACREVVPAVPWRWIAAQDLMDLLFRIEYANVPM